MNESEIKTRRDIFSSLSEFNSKQGVSFLLFVILSILTVLPIEDYQLFVDAGKITLPFFNAGLPIVPFFIVLPIVLLVFHFNILMNLNKHAENTSLLLESSANIPNIKLEVANNPFIFNNIFLADKIVPYTYVSLIIFTGIIYLPFFLMIFIQLRFSSYHNLWLTTYHFILLFIQFKLLNTFYKNVSTFRLRLYPNLRRSRFDRKRIVKILLKSGLVLSMINLTVLATLLCQPFNKIYTNFYTWNYWQPRSYDFWIPKLKIYNLDMHKDNISLFFNRISGRDFSFAYLKKINADSIDFVNVGFECAQFNEVNISKSRINNCDLRFTGLYQNNFSESQFNNVDFGNSKMQLNNFNEAQVTKVNFQAAWFTENTWCPTLFKEVNFTEGVINRDKFVSAIFNECVFDNIHLGGLYEWSPESMDDIAFLNCDFNDVSFNGAVIQSTKFISTSFRNCDLAGDYFSDCNFRYSNFEYCNVICSYWNQCDFKFSNLNFYNYYYLHLEGSQFNTSVTLNYENTMSGHPTADYTAKRKELEKTIPYYAYFQKSEYDTFFTDTMKLFSMIPDIPQVKSRYFSLNKNFFLENIRWKSDKMDFLDISRAATNAKLCNQKITSNYSHAIMDFAKGRFYFTKYVVLGVVRMMHNQVTNDKFAKGVLDHLPKEIQDSLKCLPNPGNANENIR